MIDSYKLKLRDPRWVSLASNIKKEVCRCEGCGSEHNLNVHHNRYIKGLEPWEYPIEYLDVLCCYCHERYHESKNNFNELFRNHRLFYSYENDKIFETIKLMCELETIHYTEILDYVKNIKKKQKNF